MSVAATHPLQDVVLLEHADRGGAPFGLPTNAYALIAGDEALVVDAAFDYLMPALRELAEAGHCPVGMLLTHRHLAGNGDQALFAEFHETFDAPVMLHPLDAAHPQGSAAGVELTDPAASPLPEAFELEVIHFPGQTEGSVMLYRARDGLLVAGDSAMGTTIAQAQEGVRRLVRPPQRTSVDDAQLRACWEAFERDVHHVAPLHGKPQFGQPDLEELMRPLVREAPTADMHGDPVQ
jgi:glyoxylase-like metal-dependent hydrolase (beta-lactamase superfamily II)